ncbi:MAG: VanZ family protein [Candidatus Omnitrophota bacterium]
MRYLLSWGTIYVYTCLLFLFSLLPVSAPAALVFPYYDKVIHFIIYMLLSCLVLNTLRQQGKDRPVLAGFLYAFYVGLMIEFLQLTVPYRSFELGDIACNCLGAGTGLLLKIG